MILEKWLMGWYMIMFSLTWSIGIWGGMTWGSSNRTYGTST